MTDGLVAELEAEIGMTDAAEDDDDDAKDELCQLLAQADLGTDEDAAEKIYKQLSQGLPGMISDLKVDFHDGTVTLAGECNCARTKRVATLTAGNNQGVKAVNADALTVKTESAPPEATSAPSAP